MIREIYGKKIGMTQIFNEEGDLFGTTLLEVEPVYVLEKVDYPSGAKAKIGCFKIQEEKIGKVKKPLLGYFKKLGVSPCKLIREVAVGEGASFSFEEEAKEAPEAPKQEQEPTKVKEQEQPEVQEAKELQEKTSESSAQEGVVEQAETKETPEQGAATEEIPAKKQEEKRNPREVGIEIFSEGEIVDVRSKSKGKGFAGGMKRHNWAGQPGSHGSTMHRRPGSIGSSAYPSRVIKGRDMPGHLGDAYETTKNLKILKIDKEKNILFIQGSVSGARGAVVRIRKIS